MSRPLVDCPACTRPVPWSELRSWWNGQRHRVVCRECYLELTKKYPGTGKRKRELVNEVPDGQTEPPF